MSDLESKLETYESQLNQTGIVITDLVLRLTALERLLLQNKIVTQEEYSSQLELAVTEIQKVMQKLVEENNIKD